MWGDIDDWHHTLELISRKWGPPPSPNHRFHAAEDKRAQLPTATHPPETLGSAHQEDAQLAPGDHRQQQQKQLSPASPGGVGDKPRNRPPSEHSPLAVDSPRGAGAVARSPLSPSRKQRHSASLPRPSDVEALLRKETQRRRPGSPSVVRVQEAPPPADANGTSAFVTGAAAPAKGESDSDAAASNDPLNPDTRKRASSYSAPTDLRDAFVSVNHSGAPNNEGLVLSLVELQKRPVPPTLNKATLEVYLSDDEFSSALGMPRDQFYSLRAWKQTQVKKKAGLL